LISEHAANEGENRFFTGEEEERSIASAAKESPFKSLAKPPAGGALLPHLP